MTETVSVSHVGIVGAGAMGTGIAHVFALAGIDVTLYDMQRAAAEKACNQITERLRKRMADGKMASTQAETAIACLHTADQLAALASCDLIIEAIIENIDIKIQVFTELERLVSPTTILASNTSSIPIGQIAAGCQQQDRIVGLHFFNPVPLMKLVEIIAGPATQPAIIQGLFDLCLKIGHSPVIVKDMPGFLVNFGGRAYPTEALAIEHEGIATPAQIDAIMRDCFQFRMGPFELMDLTGIDVNYPVTEFIHRCFFADPRLRSTPTHRYMLETKQLGRKTGHGFYSYAKDQTAPSADAHSTQPAADRVIVLEPTAPLIKLLAEIGLTVLSEDDGQAPILIAPIGEDCSSYIARQHMQAVHQRVIAIDTLGSTATRITLMKAPGADTAIVGSVVRAFTPSRKVTLINDSPGFVGPRIAAMVANLGCEMAQIGLASTEDIEKAMRLGLNYPVGPLALGEQLGLQNTHTILSTLQRLTGDDRYRSSQWLRRRAELNLSIYTPT